MEDLRVARSARQDAGDKKGEPARRSRRPGAAARQTPGRGIQPEDRAKTERDDGNAAASGRRKRHKARECGVRIGSVPPVIVTLLVGLTAGVILPWVVFWLSDVMVFDIPAWSLWLIFGVSPALTFLAALIQYALRILGRPSMPAIPSRGRR